MNVERLGRIARTLRIRQRLTQDALATVARVSRRAVSRLETGHGRALRLVTIEAIFAALGARLDLRAFWNGPELDRMLDAGHAALSASVKRRLERWGWMVRVEVSYSRYGERGRIDLLAWHPLARCLLVIEIKTDFVDVQALLGSLDVKVRLAPYVVAPFGWKVGCVIPAIVFAEDRAIRNRLGRVEILFDRYSLRGRAATAWLHRPVEPPSGLLWFSAVPASAGRSSGRRVYPSRRHTT